VGVLAVDPSSPFTGGAVLGDRVRMGGHAGDPGVFIRSMATRGHLGGLARTTGDAASVLDAAGFDVVQIETVGVGQDEVDIVRTADVSIVVLVPGAGDEVQALKAGIMEIADLFVVNKADLDGAGALVRALRATLALRPAEPGGWTPPVVETVATTGAGIEPLMEALQAFEAHAGVDRTRRARVRVEHRIRDLLGRHCVDRVERALAPGEFERVVSRVGAREIDPYTAAGELLARLAGGA
jgi:LAO/AO transport system kinase